jgi:cytochrome P450
MLARGPIAMEADSGILQVFGHEAVRAFLREPTKWSTAKRLETVPPEQRVVRLLTSDPPQHVSLRRHFQSAYRPKRIAELEQRIQTTCDELLDQCLGRKEFDLVGDFAKPLTVNMISDIIGVPTEDQERLMPLGKGANLGQVDRSAKPNLANALYSGGALGNVADLNAYFKELIDRRRTEPRDDLVSDLAKMTQQEMTDRLDVAALLFEQYGAGQNTTVHLIGSIFAMLDRHRDQLAALYRDPALVDGTVEETLRCHAPLQARPRIATHDFEFLGAEVREGMVALGWMQAANIDPQQFERPLDYDITRSPNPHLSFGYGEHACLGVALGRMEAKVALRSWLRRVKDYEYLDAGRLAWTDDFILHGLDHFRVTVRTH